DQGIDEDEHGGRERGAGAGADPQAPVAEAGDPRQEDEHGGADELYAGEREARHPQDRAGAGGAARQRDEEVPARDADGQADGRRGARGGEDGHGDAGRAGHERQDGEEVGREGHGAPSGARRRIRSRAPSASSRTAGSSWPEATSSRYERASSPPMAPTAS